ncbi:MAG: serine protease [Paracoccus sp. (in: a-proteobacteria)]|nr:serine protease [Paracoccus sp. (in: a-proteobacteria)]
MAAAQEVQTGLYDAFDARPLDRQEKLGLQAALAWAGDYAGALDGLWGPATQAAIEAWAARSEGRAPFNRDVARLLGEFAEAATRDGWEWVDPLDQDVPLLLPRARMEQDGALWRDAGGLSVAQRAVAPEESAARHEMMGAQGLTGRARISTARRQGAFVWLRSDPRGAVVIDTEISGPEDPRQTGRMLIAASVGLTEQPQIGITPGGQAESWIAAAAASPAQPLPRSSGSGFRITAQGAVLTSRHVIGDCAEVTVDGTPAERLAISETSDMALIAGPPGGYLALAQGQAALNSDVTVAGFPLNGLLGGLNVTRGAVSAERGIEGNATQFQFSAPIQPGSSGGPVVDAMGHVTGIVLAKLDDMLTAAEWGIIAQNVNFGLHIAPARDLLAEAGLSPPDAPAPPESPEAMGALLQSATVLIECADPPIWPSPLTP